LQVANCGNLVTEVAIMMFEFHGVSIGACHSCLNALYYAKQWKHGDMKKCGTVQGSAAQCKEVWCGVKKCGVAQSVAQCKEEEGRGISSIRRIS
jgi:hypothetical protein